MELRDLAKTRVVASAGCRLTDVVRVWYFEIGKVFLAGPYWLGWCYEVIRGISCALG